MQASHPGESDDAAHGQVTHLLGRLRDGEVTAVDQLLPLVYDELRGLAGAAFARQGRAHTLQPTALVHEAWIKLCGKLDSLGNRQHFLVVAGKAMRQVIADHARSRGAIKRGGQRERVILDDSVPAADGSQGFDLVELNDCLEGLARRSARQAQVAELRLFSGLSMDEAAEVLDLSPRSIDAEWAMAKAWLRRELAGSS